MNIRNNANYVIVGLQAYDSAIGSNCVNIARELSRTNKVLYVNFPWDTRTYFRERSKPDPSSEVRRKVMKGEVEELEQISDNLYVLYPKTIIKSITWMPDGLLYDYLNLLNNKAMARRIKKALKKLGMSNFYLFNDSDMFRSFYLKELLKPQAYIYYSRDNLITQSYFAKHGKRLEGKLIRKSDLATANSLYLRDYCAQFNPNSFYVGQGCETELFDPQGNYSRPVDLPETEKPVIGYIGALLKLRLDISLLEGLAKANPQWQFVFVGPEDEHFKRSSLHEMNNVSFTGAKKPDELPQYLYYFDVALNPQVLNELTIGNYPRKIDEYLAMGKPSVATKTRAMEIFRDHVYLASNQEEYQHYIEEAIKNDDEQKRKERISFASTHTWEESVNKIYDAMEEVLLKS